MNVGPYVCERKKVLLTKKQDVIIEHLPVAEAIKFRYHIDLLYNFLKFIGASDYNKLLK